jgi:hypothetical protein
MIEGESLSDRLAAKKPVELSAIATDLVDNLRMLASLHVIGFGELRGPDAAKNVNWREFCAAAADEGFHTLRTLQIMDHDTIRIAQQIFKHIIHSSSMLLSTLAWGDVSFSNIIVDHGGCFSGLIDFEGTLAVEATLTLGYLYCIASDHELFDKTVRFWPNKFPPVDMQKVHFYSVLRGLRLAKYLEIPLPASTSERTPLPILFPGFLRSIDYLIQH